MQETDRYTVLQPLLLNQGTDSLMYHTTAPPTDYLRTHPESTLLNALVAYDVHPHSGNFSKKTMREKPPTSYVVIM